MAIVDLHDEKDVYNIVIDHCSLSWSIDEILSFWYPSVHDVTVRQCIMSEPLNDSKHKKGAHGYGPIIGSEIKNIALIGNLLANCSQRNPYLREGSETLILNNLIFNFYIATHGRAFNGLKCSIVGNVYKKGVDSGRIMPVFLYKADPGACVYVLDNDFDKKTEDPWSIVKIKGLSHGEDVQKNTPPVWITPLTVKKNSEVTDWVLNNAGARPADRDSVDKRIINDVRNGKGRIINSQTDVGGWPKLEKTIRKLKLPDKPNSDHDGDGYTNLEEWLYLYSETVEYH